jgi:carbamoyltransferase
MFSIGISCYYHDSSLSLFKDGELIFACEEEKFTGVKHDYRFPKKTLNYVTKKYSLTKDNVDVVCFYEDVELKSQRVKEYSKKQLVTKPLLSIRRLWESYQNRRELKKLLPKISDNVFYSKHHHSHLYYSSFSSPYKTSAVVSIDGVGEYDTTTISKYDGGVLDVETISSYPHSLGLFYSAMTSFLGFKPNEGEYKVMGLTSYGNTNIKLINKVSELIKFENGEIICNLKYFNWHDSDKVMYNYELSKLLGLLPRTPDEKIKKSHKDLSYAVQKVYENVLFDLLDYVGKKYKTSNLCLGGGCAYNGLANGKIYRNTGFKKVWIPPAPSDAGSSIGAVINYYVNKGINVTIPNTPFLGPSYNINSKSKKRLGDRKTMYLSNKNLYRIVAKQIKKGKVVGWFRNEIEFGARALGNRSIIADPTNPKMKDRINKMVKKREGFRPFAPMVTKERQHEFFIMNDDLRYMNQVVEVRDSYKDIFVSTTHVDGTARVQTVYKDNDIHNLLREFELLTSYPVLLNTSFNIKDKTMVLTPQDALNTFDTTDIDVLVLNNIIIFK